MSAPARPRRRAPLLWGLLLLLAFAGGLAWAEPPGVAPPGAAQHAYGPQRRESPVYPAQEIPLRFDHGAHLARGNDCTVCHTRIATSRSSQENNFPSGATCDGCHGAQHPRPAGEEARCAGCHTRTADGTKVQASLSAPPPRLVFNHELHAKLGTSCETCHGDLAKVRLATVSQLPREAVCMSCHDGTRASDRCESCHPADRQGRLVTRPLGDHLAPPLVPRGSSSHGMEHDLAFVEDHAGVAKTDGESCRSCHDQTFCQDCHAGVVRPMRIHAGDYLTAHALDARAQTQDCTSCHRGQTDCRGCHERLGLGRGPESSFGVGSPLRFHPDDWSSPLASRQEHAFAAQRNISACASCHDEDSCLACHATAAMGTAGFSVSPHGPDFAATPRCQSLASRNRRACLKCHPPGVRELDCL